MKEWYWGNIPHWELHLESSIVIATMTAAAAMNAAEELALRCCVCGTSADDDTNYLNTKMKMLISKCGHRLYVARSLSIYLAVALGNLHLLLPMDAQI